MTPPGFNLQQLQSSAAVSDPELQLYYVIVNRLDMTIETIEGFSFVNRVLLYVSTVLAPAQYVAGVGSNCLSNLGFLGYNMYQQWMWYKVVSSRDNADYVGALYLLLPYFNMIFAISYVAGVSTRHWFLAFLLWGGTTFMIVVNTIATWKAYEYMKDGYGVYDFCFFGCRELNIDWHNYFFRIWTISGTAMCVVSVIWTIAMAVLAVKKNSDVNKFIRALGWNKFKLVIVAIFLGSFFMTIGFWPIFLYLYRHLKKDPHYSGFRNALAHKLEKKGWETIAWLCSVPFLSVGIWPMVLWTESVMRRNDIYSPTDKIAIILFAFQIAALLMPGFLCCETKTDDDDEDDEDNRRNSNPYKYSNNVAP